MGLLIPSADEFLGRAIEVWQDGGWAMIPLAINAFILFAVGIHLSLEARSGQHRVHEAEWKRMLSDPSARRGRVGEVVTHLLGSGTAAELSRRVAEIHAQEIAPFARELRFMRRAVSTAPLLGLLGTVTGMLTTFGALALGPAGDRTMTLIAGGISEALITTETGLVIAIPGLFFQHHLSRRRDRHAAFLAHLETACAQHVLRGRADVEMGS